MPFRFDVLALAWFAVAFLRDVGLMPAHAGQVLSGILIGIMLFVLLLPLYAQG